MQTFKSIINGFEFHKVIPESDDENKLAQAFLSQDGNNTFSDMGDSKCWKKFINAVEKMKQGKNNEEFNEFFDSTLRGK